eukprot:TRINITY_DN38188_c0_g1_i1.p1 TRINITY_DN38188_c0_g1~~TRINITY_DN38188_c0_g1_i1.p1  ORF type:complete len:631 (+),score=167.53 TRINITY_DN38188_c0_g1_i1:78-1970(+)
MALEAFATSSRGAAPAFAAPLATRAVESLEAVAAGHSLGCRTTLKADCYENKQEAKKGQFLSGVAVSATWGGIVAAAARRRQRRRQTRRAAAQDGGDGGDSTAITGQGETQVAEREEVDKDLDYFPTREELEREELALLEATGAGELQKKDDKYRERKQWKEENPSLLDKWEDDMEEMRNDTQRRKLWGDLKVKSGKGRRFRGKQIKLKEMEMKYNRGFPVEDPETDEEGDLQDKQWIEMWRQSWPDETQIDPHDPESFGFAFVGTVTGAHGISGDVRVRVDDFLCEQGYDPAVYLQRRNFSNWTEKEKRVHLKAPQRRFPRPFRILTGKRVQRRVFALRLQGVETVEDAMQMRGYKVFILQPPPGVGDQEKKDDFNGEDLYDANSTTFHTNDALELVGARCMKIQPVGGDAAIDEEKHQAVLGEYAAAETPEEAKQVLAENGYEAVEFGNVSAVVPDYVISRRQRTRKAAADLLDITLDPEFQVGQSQGRLGMSDKALSMMGMPAYPKETYERVAYVPFVPDMIARVDADRASISVSFSLPPGHLEKTNFTCRKRVIDEYGRLAVPRGPVVRALLPAPGRSRAMRQLTAGKRRPLHGTAPAPPADMQQPAGKIFNDPPPGVPRPPEYRP